MKIPLTKPYFGQEEKQALMEPIETGRVIQGPKVAEFEDFANAYIADQLTGYFALVCPNDRARAKLCYRAFENLKGSFDVWYRRRR